MRIPFAAYADDCTVSGGVAIEADRLTDFLTETAEFEVSDAAFRALDDGRVVEAETAALLLGDLCVIAATGPRGSAKRRLWTRQYPVRARVGPYSVVGYLHSPPTVDPFKGAERRAIVALTAATIEYSVGGHIEREQADAILLNRRKIDRLEAANEAEIRLSPASALKPAVDPKSKDMTGDLYG